MTKKVDPAIKAQVDAAVKEAVELGLVEIVGYDQDGDLLIRNTAKGIAVAQQAGPLGWSDPRVNHLTESILTMIADSPIREARTALTIAVIAIICADGDNATNAEERQQSADAFTQGVCKFVARQDIVDWIMNMPVWHALKH
jgi:hypothetical protein